MDILKKVIAMRIVPVLGLLGVLAILPACSSSSDDNKPQVEESVDVLYNKAATALDDFKQSNPDHVQHFTGYKAWNSGEDSKVKVYVAHDGMNMEFNYLCMKHDASIACHAQ